MQDSQNTSRERYEVHGGSANGITVGAQIASAQLAECRLAESTIAQLKVPRKERGRPRSHLNFKNGSDEKMKLPNDKEYKRMLKHATHVAAVLLLVVTASQTSFAQGSGADTFKAKCAMCHGNDGLGNTPIGKSLGAASYRSPGVRKMSDTDLTLVIKRGKNKMPPFAAQLTNAQIKELLKYIHTLQK